MIEIFFAALLGLLIAGFFIWIDKNNDERDKRRARIMDLESQIRRDEKIGESK